jgi:type I restriction enzyme, S subunit
MSEAKTEPSRARGSAGQHQGGDMRKGWETKNLGDLCDVVGGGTPPKDKPAFYSGDIPWATVRDMRQDVITETEFRITKDAVKSSATNIIPSGNVVIATRVGLGKVCLLGQDTAINQDLRGIVPRSDKALVIRYLYWWLKSIADVIVAEGTGATVQGVKLPFVKSLQIPVPPLAEQQRIVGLLDEAFEGLATAKSNAEKNLQNARALFESHLQSVFTQRGPGWVETTLEDIADSDCSLSYGIVQPGEEFDEGMPIVRPTDLTTKVIRLGGLKRIDPKLAGGYKRTALQGGELLLCVRGSTGVVSIASPELAGANVTRGIVPIRFNRSLLLPEFGFYLISGRPVQSQIREKTYGTALMQINIRDLRLISLSIPPLKEQKTIAAKLDSLHEETQHLARLYEQKLAALEALKKSLLHQAFTGEL